MLPDKETVRTQLDSYDLEISDKNGIRKKLNELEALRRTAEANILEETDEDDGL